MLGKSDRQNLQGPVEKQSSKMNTTASTSKIQLPEKAEKKNHSTTSIKIGSIFQSPEQTKMIAPPVSLIYTSISKSSEAEHPIDVPVLDSTQPGYRAHPHLGTAVSSLWDRSLRGSICTGLQSLPGESAKTVGEPNQL